MKHSLHAINRQLCVYTSRTKISYLFRRLCDATAKDFLSLCSGSRLFFTEIPNSNSCCRRGFTGDPSCSCSMTSLWVELPKNLKQRNLCSIPLDLKGDVKRTRYLHSPRLLTSSLPSAQTAESRATTASSREEYPFISATLDTCLVLETMNC